MLGTPTATAFQATPTGTGEAPHTALDATGAVEAVLAAHLAARLREAREVDPGVRPRCRLRVAAFVLRGGKRLRTAFVWCGWRAAGGNGDAEAAAAYRSGPGTAPGLRPGARRRDGRIAAAPGRARRARGLRPHAPGGHACAAPPRSYSTAAAVLAGDLALAWADDLLTETALDSPHGARAAPRVAGHARRDGGRAVPATCAPRRPARPDSTEASDHRDAQERALHRGAAARSRRVPGRRRCRAPWTRCGPPAGARDWPSSSATTCSARSATRR